VRRTKELGTLVSVIFKHQFCASFLDGSWPGQVSAFWTAASPLSLNGFISCTIVGSRDIRELNVAIRAFFYTQRRVPPNLEHIVRRFTLSLGNIMLIARQKAVT
jgi:hypothetical protein